MKSEEIVKQYNADKAERRIVKHRDQVINDGCGNKMKKNDEGFLCGSASVAKVGVMSYLMEDGSILREFVPPETLFNEDSMHSLKMKPVTNTHPSSKKVNSSNASYTQIGYTGEDVKQDGDYLVINLTITDEYAIADVEDGRQELSPGYAAELVMQEGEYEGKEYDAIQVKRTYNHLSIVDNARGGTDIRMNLDGFELYETNEKEYSMSKFNIDGIQYEASPEVVNYITKSEKALTDAKDELSGAQKDLDKVSAERDALKAKVDELEKIDHAADIAKGVQERIALLKKADSVKVECENIDELDNRAIKVAIINKRFPSIVVDSESSDVRLDAILETIEDKVDEAEVNLDEQKKVSTPIQKSEPKADSADDARKRMIQADEDAWKPENK